MRRIPALDGLRGVAVLFVLVFHTTYLHRISDLDEVTWRMTRGLNVGVDIFFVLSGFLITGILIRTRHQPRYFRNFYIKRLLRIFPLYYLVIAVSVFAPILFPFLQANDVPILPYWGANFWLFLSNIWGAVPHPILGVSWSLSYEEQFYMFWPLVVLMFAGANLTRACLGLICVGVTSRGLLAFDVSENLLLVLLARLDLLAIGALVAIWDTSDRHPTEPLAWRFSKILAATAALALAVICWTAEGFWGPYMTVFGKLAVGGLTAAAIIAIKFCPAHFGVGCKMLEWRALCSFGKYSYAIYLLHSPLDAVLRRAIDINSFVFPILGTELPMQTLYWGLIGAICWCAGWSSWHLIEMHFLKFKSTLAKPPQ